MAKKPETNEGQITIGTFLSYLKKEKIVELKRLGSREVLDYLMEAIEYRERGSSPQHEMFHDYSAFKVSFLNDPFAPEWVRAVISLFEKIGFSSDEIKDAFRWYFSNEHTEAMTHPDDEGKLNDLQEVIEEAFAARQWASPFQSLQ